MKYIHSLCLLSLCWSGVIHPHIPIVQPMVDVVNQWSSGKKVLFFAGLALAGYAAYSLYAKTSSVGEDTAVDIDEDKLCMELEKQNVYRAAAKEITDQQVIKALQDGNIPLLLAFADAGKDINIKNEYNGDTLLHSAALNSALPLVTLLLASGADVNVLNDEHLAPLHAAVASKDAEIMVKTLLDAGADVNVGIEKGCSPLILAIFKGDTAIVELLLNAGARVDQTDMFGRSLMIIAQEAGVDNAIISLLVKHGLREEVQPPFDGMPVENEVSITELQDLCGEIKEVAITEA